MLVYLSLVKHYMQKLQRKFYTQDTLIVAEELLGNYLVYRHNGIEQIGKIVEVEAYLGTHDLASHSAKGLTKRTKIMFGPSGYAYIYLIYGMYHCFNIVTEPEGQGTAVLIRAIEPIKNIIKRTNGPGLLAKAMNITAALNGYDLLSNDLFIAKNINYETIDIVKKPRIGVSYAKDWATKLLRFYIKNNQFVSKL